jgi:TIR domain-containing protein
MQGIELVAELADRDISSEILVVSGNLGPTEMWEAMMAGAGAALPKPFDDFRVAIRKMQTLAEVGRRRRLHKLNGQTPELDRKRLHRPVFLSYSSRDKKMANGLRRNLESKDISVWYAPTALEGGQIWRKDIQDGIQNASIFVALVTANYLESPHCFGELMRFQARMEGADQTALLLLPLLCVSQRDVTRNQTFGPILRDFQGIDLTSRFNDALTLLLGRIQSKIVKGGDADPKHPSRAELNVISSPSSDRIA